MTIKALTAALFAAVLAVSLTACQRDNNAGAGSSAKQDRSTGSSAGSGSSAPSSPSGSGGMSRSPSGSK